MIILSSGAHTSLEVISVRAISWISLYTTRSKAIIGIFSFNPKQAGGGGHGIRPQAGSSLCCAETVSSRKLHFSA